MSFEEAHLRWVNRFSPKMNNECRTNYKFPLTEWTVHASQNANANAEQLQRQIGERIVDAVEEGGEDDDLFACDDVQEVTDEQQQTTNSTMVSWKSHGGASDHF